MHSPLSSHFSIVSLNPTPHTHPTHFHTSTGTKIYVTTGVVEGLRCFFIEPKNGFFDTQSVYGRYDDEASVGSF